MKIPFSKIDEAKELLGIDAAHIIAKDLNLEDWDDKSLKAKSIFREERTASMIWDRKMNCFHDFSSGNNYGIIDHIMKFENKPYHQAVKDLFDLVGENYKESDFDENYSKDVFKNYRYPKDEPVNDRKIVEDYMLKRHILTDTLDYCNVKQDAHGNVAFQFKDLNGKHIATKYRVSKAASNKDFKWFWQKDSDTCPILYGVDKVDSTKPLVICEGLVDRLAIVEAGYSNVVSIPGGAEDSGWIDFNYDLLEGIEQIILWYDDDEVGKNAVKSVINRLGIYKCKLVQPPKDMKDNIREYYSAYTQNPTDKADANNILVTCGKDAVLYCINNAKEIENPRVKKLMDFDEVQLSDLPSISTGFKAMDKVMYGNFLNSFVVLTGKAGQGKSCILNEMYINEPLESKEKVFIYSGEMPAGMLLANILRPMASNRHILEFDNSAENKPNGYAVTHQASEAMKKYYRDYLYVYDDSDPLASSPSALLETMTYCYRRHGVRNFVIDNLLTVDSTGSGDDKWNSQIEFVKNLKRFTRMYDVRVLLVAHSRKLQAGSKEITGDDIQGCSETFKVCDRAYSVGILSEDPDGYNSCVSVLKDRQTGKVDKRIKLFYDHSSLRIYSDEKELNRMYSWERDTKIEYSENIKKQLVCNKRPSYSQTNEIFGE